MTVEELRQKIDSEPDFVAIKRFDCSLQKVLDKYPEGAPPKVIAQALLMTEEEVEELLESVIKKIRSDMKVEL